MNTTKILSVISGLVLLSACGSQVARESSSTTSASGTSNATGTQTSSSGNIYGNPLAKQVTVKLNGINGAVPSATYPAANSNYVGGTSSLLKIKVTPLSAPNLTLNGYTNWVFPYGCLRLQVSVNGTTQTTQILRVDGASQGSTSVCKNAPTYQVLDFTNATTGNGIPNVTISNPEYDNCRYTWPLNYGCSMSAIFMNHIIAATIDIQVDGTYMTP